MYDHYVLYSTSYLYIIIHCNIITKLSESVTLDTLSLQMFSHYVHIAQIMCVMREGYGNSLITFTGLIFKKGKVLIACMCINSIDSMHTFTRTLLLP